MGIDNFYYREFHKLIKTDLTDKTNKKVLCLGYPDLLVTEDVLIELYDADFVANIPEDPLPDEIRRWHKRNLPKVYDSLFLLRYHGFEPIIFDGVVHRGFEKVVNLNEQLPVEYLEQFDLVIDTGTLEHCFNVGIAFKNVCQAIKKDGYFMTAAPVTKLDHGYWNFCTLVYKDGFRSNGFELLETKYFKGEEELPLSVINRKRIPLSTVTFAIAKRKEIKDWVWPIQEKYLK